MPLETQGDSHRKPADDKASDALRSEGFSKTPDNKGEIDSHPQVLNLRGIGLSQNFDSALHHPALEELNDKLQQAYLAGFVESAVKDAGFQTIGCSAVAEECGVKDGGYGWFPAVNNEDFWAGFGIETKNGGEVAVMLPRKGGEPVALLRNVGDINEAVGIIDSLNKGVTDVQLKPYRELGEKPRIGKFVLEFSQPSAQDRAEERR